MSHPRTADREASVWPLSIFQYYPIFEYPPINLNIIPSPFAHCSISLNTVPSPFECYPITLSEESLIDQEDLELAKKDLGGDAVVVQGYRQLVTHLESKLKRVGEGGSEGGR